MSQVKYCKHCDKQHDVSAFGKNKASKDGLFRYCRTCSSAKSRNRSHLRRQTMADRYRLYQQNAKVRGCGFSLSLDHFIDLTSQTCTYCDQFTSGKSHVGIDRLVNNEGYTIANSVPCCWTCNRMKRDMDVGEFLDQLRRIV